MKKHIDLHMIREKVAMFLVAQAINKKGELYYTN